MIMQQRSQNYENEERLRINQTKIFYSFCVKIKHLLGGMRCGVG